MCILHCIMAMGRLLVQFLETLYNDLDMAVLAGVQCALHGARNGIRLGSATLPDGEEVYCLPQSREQVRDAACLDVTHPAGRAVFKMWPPLRQLYRTY